ncbi:MAG TPA: DUF2207 domain-containing protein [Saprospiraceae bacterium]|nr:DUF2207 domain-containing protein [Saprospiraceae bacterium]
MGKRWILLLLPFWLLAFNARAEYFTIKHYHVNVTFNDEGNADFVETIEVEFSQPRHGIYRFIPFRNKISGRTVDYIIKDVDVEGYKFSRSKENNNLVLQIGDADVYVDGVQTYRIHYRVINPINFFEEHSEFYWDLLGISWETDVEDFTYEINFPSRVNLTENDVFGYTGTSGAKGTDMELKVMPKKITGKTTKTFTPGEGVTVAVRFPKDTFPQPSGFANFLARHGLILIAPIFLLGGLLARFYARNKRQTIMTEFFPPEGISPVVAGGFVDHSVDNNDVLSLIPHLANKGYLRLEAEEGKGFFKKNNIIFYKLKDAGKELMVFEEQFFNALFASGDLVELNALKDKFYSHMASVKLSVREWIKLQGWYEPDQKAMGCVTGLAGLIAAGWGAYAVFARQNLDGIWLAGAGFILFYFASRFNKRSPAGNVTYQKLEGFRQFVAKAERPVIERLMKDDPLYYDKTMPFALAFGYLKQWNKNFEGLLSQPPSWYSSPMMYGSGLNSWNTFSENFPSEINSIDSVFASAPSGGSGGGFSGGGGSSGGGGGGGGGGSW